MKKIKIMKRIIFTTLILISILSTANSQNTINFKQIYPGGRGIQMFVDSNAKNVYYGLKFPNQPNTSFNFLPDVNNISFQFNFKKNSSIELYRYTLLVDDKPIEVNKNFNKDKIFPTEQPDDNPYGNDTEEVNSINIGNYFIKGKVITILLYSTEKPLEIYKSVFYAKSLPKANMIAIGKRFSTENGVDYKYFLNPEKQTNLQLTTKDDEITILKNTTDIDYIYHVLIKDIQTNKIIYESTAWQYGGHIDEVGMFAPYLKFDKAVFKKSGDYEIIIKPMINWNNCLECNMTQHDIEKYSSKYIIKVDLQAETTFTAAQLGTYIGIACAFIGTIAGMTMAYLKRKNKSKLINEQQQKQLAQLKLNSVRAQLNPHFLFNSLAGIQNLMNKKDIENANKYLAKFARLTRNVLENNELISLDQEKKLLDDYLQMEQLRFGFEYKISSSENLNTENIEIPAMLLQPFVENAIKHGIFDKGSEGKIQINFGKQLANLILQIKDNGSGFNPEKNSNGLGLALSKDRIEILNTIHKESPIILNMESNKNGTTITITLTEWL